MTQGSLFADAARPAAPAPTTTLVNASCLDWLREQPPESIHAVLTDPPFTVVDFSKDELQKMRDSSGGTWRKPMTMNGSIRRPQPRFTELTPAQKQNVYVFFHEWATLLLPVLTPGAHVLVAINDHLNGQITSAIEDAGFELRGQLVRLVRTFRGGDRPKGAEKEYPDVSTTPRAAHEPWLMFSKPLNHGMTLEATLRTYGTGALRRAPTGQEYSDVMPSEKATKAERAISDHPTMKPQSWLRPLARMLLPLGTGVLLDPFMGSGSTIAAAQAMGVASVGIELDPEFYQATVRNVPRLAQLPARDLLSQDLDEDDLNEDTTDENTQDEQDP